MLPFGCTSKCCRGDPAGRGITPACRVSLHVIEGLAGSALMLRCCKKRESGHTWKSVPPLGRYSLNNERIPTIRLTTTEAPWTNCQSAWRSLSDKWGFGTNGRRTARPEKGTYLIRSPFLRGISPVKHRKAHLHGEPSLCPPSYNAMVAGGAGNHSSALCGFENLPQRPYRSRDASGHCRSHPQGFVHPAEVVPS